MREFNETFTAFDDRSDEVALFDKLPLFKLSENQTVLQWWHAAGKAQAYPALRKLAMMLHAVPASSASSERLFSAAGRVLEARRQNLSPETVDAILFLRSKLAGSHTFTTSCSDGSLSIRSNKQDRPIDKGAAAIIELTTKLPEAPDLLLIA